jgi:small subunit ribosomal protein S6
MGNNNFVREQMAAKNVKEESAQEENKSEENKKFRDYELIYIVNPEVVEDALESTIGNVSQFIAGKGGIVSDEERWGKRRLAYPIKRFLEGSYILTRFKMEPVWSKELEANLEISEDVLRHLLIRAGD